MSNERPKYWECICGKRTKKMVDDFKCGCDVYEFEYYPMPGCKAELRDARETYFENWPELPKHWKKHAVAQAKGA